MFEVKIYGEIINLEGLEIVKQGGYCNLSSVQEQLSKASGKPVRVRINSIGGDVDTGFAIYHELRRYAKKNKVEIETFGEANVSSIATVIFLAGDSRILTESTSPFVHNAWTYGEGDGVVMRTIADNLEKASDLIAKHYETHTDLSYDEAREFMDGNTYITPEEAKVMRFATGIEKVLRPKAMLKFNTKINKKSNVMSAKKGRGILAKAVAFLAGIKAKLVTTADETELDFYDLADEDTIQVGDMANVNDEPAEGEYVMKDGETYVFVSGELTEIIAAEAEEEEEESASALSAEEIVALQAHNKELEDTLSALLVNSEKQNKEIKTLRAAVKSPSPQANGGRTAPTKTVVKPEVVAAKGDRASKALASVLKPNTNK
jgi:ATP-dependent protease ClpP protease subunit